MRDRGAGNVVRTGYCADSEFGLGFERLRERLVGAATFAVVARMYFPGLQVSLALPSLHLARFHSFSLGLFLPSVADQPVWAGISSACISAPFANTCLPPCGPAGEPAVPCGKPTKGTYQR